MTTVTSTNQPDVVLGAGINRPLLFHHFQNLVPTSVPIPSILVLHGATVTTEWREKTASSPACCDSRTL
jgi:hypothetical protein